MLARINMTIRRNIVDSLAIPHRRCLSPVKLNQWVSQVEGGIHHSVGKHRFLTILKIMTNWLILTAHAIREERAMRQVNMHEAKTHLSELVKAVEAGEVVEISS